MVFGAITSRIPHPKNFGSPRGKGEPLLPVDTIGNLDKGEVSHLNFRVPKAFHKQFSIFAITQEKSQTEVLYEAFDLLKVRHEVG